jgi:hypothetical protein
MRSREQPSLLTTVVNPQHAFHKAPAGCLSANIHVLHWVCHWHCQMVPDHWRQVRLWRDHVRDQLMQAVMTCITSGFSTLPEPILSLTNLDDVLHIVKIL